MTFGIREKISLLVILATAGSALLVQRGLREKAQEVLRDHEIVDLGDEASLRGWQLADRVDGLAEDLMNLAFSSEFQDAVVADLSAEALNETAQKYCRRYWTEYLHIDIIEEDGPDKSFKTIHSPVDLRAEDLWEPEDGIFIGAQMHLSPIQRYDVTYPATEIEPEITQGTPMIWGIAPLNQFAMAFEGPRRYIRIASRLGSGTSNSPRHFYILENADGETLQRADELLPIGEGNDAVFQSLSQDQLLTDKIDSWDSDDPDAQQPRVAKLVKQEFVKLDRNYYFLEGTPNPGLRAGLDFDSDGTYLEELRSQTRDIGRVGGISGVKEIRLLAPSREALETLRDATTDVLKEHFSTEYDGIDWRGVVECDEIHTWSVQVLIGNGDNLDRYLIHYAVMDDELASSVNHELKTLRKNAILIAGCAGILAFIIAMLFIRPLKQMTHTAQQITKSRGDNLSSQLQSLISGLATSRRDEVGDISRASKRLFEEIIEAQEHLEQRVQDRTADLRKVNYDLEQANVQLMSLSHEKDAFVAKVSHDLRQPLNAIFLQIEALKLSELDTMQLDDVDKIQSHAQRELNLVNDILEYQKIIMGAETLVRDEVDIAALATDLESTYQPTAAAKDIGFSLTVADEIGSLTADDRRLRQVLGNLLGNACKFTKEGQVSLHIEPQTVRGEEWVEFTVADSGRGMSPEEQSKAFVPFVSNKKDNAGGTGLGLSICKELTERMGGRIGFVSELGSGTSFSLLMPRVATSEHYDTDEEKSADGSPAKPALASSAHEAAAQIAQHADAKPGGHGAKVLVIDDDPSVRELLKRLLEGDGYRVLTAEDGAEGLAIARSEHPEAITLDVVMPGDLDGWAVLKELKNHPDTEGIPVIMVSIMAEADNGFALDVEDYLVKPVDMDRLSRVVSRVTSSSLQRNLLIVDDDVDSRETLGRLLKESGWESHYAGNGVEALAALKVTRPAAIVLDLMMPEMDGFEFLKVVQDDEQLATIPVIVMTGKEPSREELIFLEERVGMILKKEDDSGSRRVLQTITQKLQSRPKS